MRFHGRDAIDALAGATWGEVAQAALAQGRIPPVTMDSDDAERGRHASRLADARGGLREMVQKF